MPSKRMQRNPENLIEMIAITIEIRTTYGAPSGNMKVEMHILLDLDAELGRVDEFKES